MNKLCCLLFAAVVLYIAIAAEGKNATRREGEKMQVKIKSAAFEEGGTIPAKYTCDGDDVSPPLAWDQVPYGTKSIALISDDPDAPMGTWVHWVVFNLPADLKGLPESVPTSEALDDGGKQGLNDFGKIGYGGPCPPAGTHRYFFKIYALDKALELSGRVTKAQLLTAMEGHILAEGQSMGRYKR